MDFYVILGVVQEASLSELKRAYKRLSRRYHPDINPGDREAAAFFRRATEAYETLSDPDRRHQYDAHGAPLTAVEGASVEFRGFDFSGPVAGASATFGELFSEILPDLDEAPGVRGDRGSDLFGEVALSFEEALQGAERTLSLSRLVTCEGCGGQVSGEGRRSGAPIAMGLAPADGSGGTWSLRSRASTAAVRAVSANGHARRAGPRAR